uniref:Putative tritil protein n=1 Tax=Rhipicephalus pulchellus TaxID=72859 RepID=L7LQK5_RHIPC
MHQITIALAALCIAVVRGNSTCQDCGTTKCGPNEVPVVGNPRQDLFCRPLYTPPLVFKELRKCVCKPNFVRNSWGECVDRKSCERCKPRMQKDWHTCSSSCPITANKTISLFCRTMCTPGCDCPPGWVLDPRNWKHCVEAIKYPPICPPNSRFEPCVSTCEPVCGLTPPRPCFTHCHRGACVCNKGFAAFVRSGVMICVRQEKCPWYLRRTHLSVLNRTAYAEGASAHGVANNAGGFETAPDGMVTPRPSGRIFSGNVNRFVGVGSRGNSGIDLSHTAISTGVTSFGSEAGSRRMVAGITPPSSETGSGAVGSSLGGSTLSTASGRTATISMTAPGALAAMSPGMITAGANGVRALTPDSAGMNPMHASFGAAGSHAGVSFIDRAHSSDPRPAGAAVLSAGRGHGVVAGHVENTLPSTLAGTGGVGTGASSALTAVYSGRRGNITGIGGTSARTPSSVDSGGIRAALGSTGTHEGVHTEHGALSSGSRTAGAGGLSAGTVHGSIGVGVGNTLSHMSVPSSNNDVGAGNAHMAAVSSVSTGVMSGLGGTIAHKPLASQPSGVRAGLGSTGTDGGVHTTPGTNIIGPGTSLASSSLLSATERMRVIRSSLVIPSASASRTPESVSAETSALRRSSGIRGSIGAETGTASTIGVNLEAPGTHLSHVERGAVNKERSMVGSTRFLSSATGLGAMVRTTGSEPTPFTGDPAMSDTNARSVYHGASFRPDVVGAGTRATSTSPDFSSGHGEARFRLGTAQMHPSASAGSDMNSLSPGSAGTTGSLSLAAPGLSRVGTNTVSVLAPSSVGGIMGAREASGGISEVSARPSIINAGISTSGTSQPLAAGPAGVDLGSGAATSPSHGLARPDTINVENRQPSFPLGTGGASVMTGAGSSINVAGENSHLTRGFSNVVNRSVVSTTMSSAPVLSGTPERHGLSGSTGTEEGLTPVSRESGGSGIVIGRESEAVRFGGGNARTSVNTAGNGVASGATRQPEGARSGHFTAGPRGNNVIVTVLPPSTTLGSHSGTVSSYIGGSGAGGFTVSPGATGSRDAGELGAIGTTTNTHSTHASGSAVPSFSRETSGITGTDTYAETAGRTGPGGIMLPSAATSSVNGLGTYLSGVTTEGIWNTRTAGGVHSGRANTNGTVRHGEGAGSTYEVGQYFPNTAGYHGTGYGVNPYLPGFMLHGGKYYANTYLTVKPADTNILGGTRSDPIRYTSLGGSETSLPGNTDIGGIQPNTGGATIRTTTSL